METLLTKLLVPVADFIISLRHLRGSLREERRKSFEEVSRLRKHFEEGLSVVRGNLARKVAVKYDDTLVYPSTYSESIDIHASARSLAVFFEEVGFVVKEGFVQEEVAKKYFERYVTMWYVILKEHGFPVEGELCFGHLTERWLQKIPSRASLAEFLRQEARV